jgi:Virus neck protein
MTVSQYFNHIQQTEEQDLVHDLAVELIQLSGIDVTYIKVDATTDGNFNEIFGENRFEKLNGGTVIEMYLKNMETPYEGEDLYAKFGLQQSQSCSFVVSLRRFKEVFGHRPREGDYIYIPVWKYNHPDDIFKISNVTDTDEQFSPLGNSIFYLIKTERAKFTHQEVNTNVGFLNTETLDMVNNDSVINDTNANNDPLQVLSDAFVDFSETNPFGNI